MLLASSILTFAGLAGLGAAAAAAYFYFGRRPAQAARPAPMPAPAPTRAAVTVRGVVEQLVTAGDHATTYLDRDTGRFVTLRDDLRADLEGNQPLDDELDSSGRDLKALRHKLKSKVLVRLPTKAETKEFLLQERFCQELPEGEARHQMLKVLSGQTGFRSFDGAVKRLGLESQWHELRDAEFARIAEAWLERNGMGSELDL